MWSQARIHPESWRSRRTTARVGGGHSRGVSQGFPDSAWPVGNRRGGAIKRPPNPSPWHVMSCRSCCRRFHVELFVFKMLCQYVFALRIDLIGCDKANEVEELLRREPRATRARRVFSAFQPFSFC